MKFKTLNGKDKNIPIQKYKIDWNGKSLSIIQRKVKQFLYPYWKNYFVVEEAPCAGTRLKLDIYNVSRQIAIEIQGKQHYNFNKFYHNNSLSQYKMQLRRDETKEKWCELNGIQLVLIYEEEIDDISAKWFLDKYQIIL